MRDRTRRYRAPVAIVALAGLLLAHAWLWRDTMRQARVLQSALVLALASLALLSWFLLWSGASRRTRGAIALVCGVLALGSFSLLRVRGVTGDLVPILGWRWQATPAPVPLVAASPSPSARAEAAIETAPQPTASPTAAPRDPAPVAPAARLPTLHDHAGFQGADRSATIADVELDSDWAARPPRVLWRRPVGAAWSGFAIAGQVAVTQEQHAGEERVVAYELATGRVLWSHAERARYVTVIAGEGPRATPTIAGGRVFAMGATGRLIAIDLSSGRRLWSHDVPAETGASEPDWGRSGSPLFVDGRVVVSAGGPDRQSLVAYEAEGGARAWAAGSDRVSYSSPFVTTLAGRRQIVILNVSSLTGHDPASGQTLWEQTWPAQQANVSQPLPLAPDRLLVSVGYGVGSKLFQLAPVNDELRSSLVWESPRLKSKFATLVARDGFVYGLDDGVLTCLDLQSGERRWKAGRYGHGQLLRVGGLLLVQSEEGEMVLVEATPDEHRERARFSVFEGKTWNPPALASPYLLVRNDREAALLELPLAQPN